MCKNKMTKPSSIKDLITLTELARLRRVSRQTIYNWLQQGKAPRHERIGGRFYFYRSDAADPADRNP